MTAPIGGFTRAVAEGGASGNASEGGAARGTPGADTDFREALTEALREPVPTRRSRNAARREAPSAASGDASERLAPVSPPPSAPVGGAPAAPEARGAADDTAPNDAPAATHAGGGEPSVASTEESALIAGFVEMAIGTGAAGLGAGATVAAAAAPTTPMRSPASDVRESDPSAVRRSTAALAPELRLRLERVIERMKSEFGYSVEVVETVRSQARQEELFAQGRTAAGPVVTWTRNSKHTAGNAADVIIDGSYGNPAAYETLARVAGDEGLKSLWPRDGGHIELAGAARGAAGGAEKAALPAPPIPILMRAAVDPRQVIADVGANGDGAAPPLPRIAGLPLGAPGDVAPVAPVAPVATIAPVARVHAVAEVAQVARIAPVADVASVASVASVARVSSVQSVSQGARADESSSSTPSAPALAAAAGHGTIATAVAGASGHGANSQAGDDTGGRTSGGRTRSDDEGERDRGAAMLAALDGRDDGALARHSLAHDGASRTVRGDGVGGGEAVGGLARSDATERIARVLKMQEASGDRPLSSVLLRLDAPDGGEDRVRIDLRGSSVGMSFDVSDPRAADNMRSHAHELRQALGRRGLEGDSMTVRTTQRSTEPASLNAAALAAERDGMRIGSTAASDGGGSTAKDSRNQPSAEQWRDGASQQRSRQQRRDGKENR